MFPINDWGELFFIIFVGLFIAFCAFVLLVAFLNIHDHAKKKGYRKNRIWFTFDILKFLALVIALAVGVKYLLKPPVTTVNCGGIEVGQSLPVYNGDTISPTPGPDGGLMLTPSNCSGNNCTIIEGGLQGVGLTDTTPTIQSQQVGTTLTDTNTLPITSESPLTVTSGTPVGQLTVKTPDHGDITVSAAITKEYCDSVGKDYSPNGFCVTRYNTN